MAYHKTHYVPEASVIVVSGKLDEAKILSQIENLFGGIKKDAKSIRPNINDKQDKALVKIQHKESDQTHIVLAFRSFINNHMDDKVYQAGLLSAVLGSGMSSRLFHRIREELGFAYYIHASHHAELDYGLFTIGLGVSNKNVTKALEAIFTELRKIKDELVNEDELRRVKDMRTGHLYHWT